MRYPLIIGMSFLALPFLIVTSLYIAISLAVGMAVGATVTGVSAHKRHQRTIHKHQAALRAAFGIGVEAHRRYPH